MLISLKMDSTSYVQRPQHAGISHTVTGPRTQSWLSSATVWLFTRLFVVIRKKKARCGRGEVGVCSRSLGLEYGNMAGLEAWTLGRDE